MRRRISYIIFFLLIIQNIFSYSFCGHGIANAQTPKVEVLIEGVDEEPKGKIIGVYGPITKGLNYGIIVVVIGVQGFNNKG